MKQYEYFLNDGTLVRSFLLDGDVIGDVASNVQLAHYRPSTLHAADGIIGRAETVPAAGAR